MDSLRASGLFKNNPVISARYLIGAHYGTKATCGRCHRTPSGAFIKKPRFTLCADCHEGQTRTFGEGAHGAGRTPGTGDATDRRPGCGACHDSHSLRLENARREACAGCHGEDLHVQNYEKSGHYRFLSDPVFAHKPMTGIDCAGCHMPRVRAARPGLDAGVTDHNESWTVAYKEAMATQVCADCHGLLFALRALYDREVVRSNFTVAPTAPPPGLEYALGALEK